jgi:hypothetical protein
MKLFLTLCLLVTGLVTSAQQTKDSTSNNSSPTSKEQLKERRNEVSLEFLGLIDGRFIPAYERSFGKHWSAKIGAGPKSREGLINLSGLDGEKIKTGDLNYSGFIVYGEGRYYVNEFLNGRAVGFYMGLYLKYSGFQTDIGGTYTNSADEDFNFLFDTSIGVRSVGFMIGYKLPIRKRFAIDFIIAGPGTANYSFDIRNKSDRLPDEFFDDLNAILEEYNLLDLINADFDFRINDRKSVFNTVNFRYSISFTYNF